MLTIPSKTFFNKRIPKQKFYENINVTAEIKKEFTEKIRSIYWRNKICPDTMNIANGHNVMELEVFEVNLQTPGISEKVLHRIDMSIPYHILFLLYYEDKIQAWICYKEISENQECEKIYKYYHSDWIMKDDFDVRIEGLNMDDMYASIIQQIAEGNLSVRDGEQLKDAIIRNESQAQIRYEIEQLEKKARAEKQPKKKFELVQKIRNLQTTEEV